MSYEVVVMVLFALAAWRFKSRYTSWCMMAYVLGIAFSFSELYEIIAPSYSYIHICYALITCVFMPICNRNFYAVLGLALYSIFNLIIALDYLFYPPLGIISATLFLQLHTILVFCLIYLSTKKVDNDGNSDPTIAYLINWMGHMSRSIKRIQRV